MPGDRRAGSDEARKRIEAGHIGFQQDDPAEFRRNVDQAIDKGVEWLKKKQQPSGDFGESSGPTYGPEADSGGRIVVRNLPGRDLVRASVGAWNDAGDLERLLSALDG